MIRQRHKEGVAEIVLRPQQVAYYCSVECQKKGWTLHKTECKERQNEQKEWDAALAIIDAVRTSRPQTS